MAATTGATRTAPRGTQIGRAATGVLIAGHAIDTGTGTGGDYFAADKVWL